MFSTLFKASKWWKFPFNSPRFWRQNVSRAHIHIKPPKIDEKLFYDFHEDEDVEEEDDLASCKFYEVSIFFYFLFISCERNRKSKNVFIYLVLTRLKSTLNAPSRWEETRFFGDFVANDISILPRFFCSSLIVEKKGILWEILAFDFGKSSTYCGCVDIRGKKSTHNFPAIHHHKSSISLRSALQWCYDKWWLNGGEF